jgi:integrase
VTTRPAGCPRCESLGLTWGAVDLDRGIIDVSWQLQALPYLDRRDRTSGFRVPDGFESRHLTGQFHLTRPKTGHGRRTIPLVSLMVDALTLARASWTPNPWDLVWVSPTGQPIRDEDDRARWHDLQRQAGVAHPSGRPYHLHETRHTVVSLLIQAGVDRSVIESIVGHATLVEAYVHVEDAQARSAMEGLATTLRLGH